MDNRFDTFIKEHKVTSTQKIGNTLGAPNIILINEPKEVGNQGYELLLCDEIKVEINSNILEIFLEEEAPDDIIIFPGQYDLEQILKICSKSKARVHIDIANGIKDLSILSLLNKKFENLIISTSSLIFRELLDSNVQEGIDKLFLFGNNILLKENRGGSRYFTSDRTVIQVPAQTRPVTHSVGVGDCFDVIFIALQAKYSKKYSLYLASWIAAEYASTTFPDDFKNQVRQTLLLTENEISNLGGVSLKWEDRKDINIYIAAPDFDFVNRTHIDLLADSLNYHNFKPRLPVRENGQMEPDATTLRRKTLFHKDMEMLKECKILIAVLLYDDPGTLIEIGIAGALKMPVLVYDPFNKAQNCMLTEFPDLVTSDIDEIISTIFHVSGKLIKNGE